MVKIYLLAFSKWSLLQKMQIKYFINPLVLSIISLFIL